MLNEIVLINNDKYGAPELKKMYQGYTLKGFIIALTIHIALIAAYMLTVYINNSSAKDIPLNPKERIINVDDILPPSIEDKELPIKEEITEKIKDLASLEPQPVRKDIADDVVMKTQDELNNLDANTSREGDSLVASNNTKIDDSNIDDKVKTVIKDDVIKIYNDYEVDKAPECINLSQVKASMKYPELAVETGLEGRVTVKVLVNSDGNVIKVGSVNGPELFHDEVKEKAQDLNFTPGLQNNKPVKVWVTVPFSFKLK